MAGKGRKAVVLTALLSLAVVLIMGSTTVATATSSPIVIPVKFPELQVSTSNGITTLKMEGCPNSREVGNPVVPFKSLTVAVPPDTVATKVSVTNTSWSRLPGTYKVEWGQPPAPTSGKLTKRVSENPATYDSNNPYPEKPAELKSTGRMRKVSLGDISLNPVKYYPESGVIEVCSEMTVGVDYSNTSLPASEKKADRSPADAASVVDNPQQASQWYGGGTSGGSGNTADYLIITTDALASAAAPLASYRQSQGLSVKTVTTSWIYANYTGVDNQEKIRNFLKDKYLSWGITYVLIVGSDTSVPMRRAYCANNRGYFEDYIPTDYYYSDISGNWDLNGDGKYGQFYYDGGPGGVGPGGVDFYPEVYVGRIPLDNVTDVSNYCSKVVAFCLDSGAWKHRMLLPEAILNFPNEDGTTVDAAYGSPFGEKVKNDIATPLGYGTCTLYEKGGVQMPPISPDPGACDLPLNTANVADQWNNVGYGVIPWSSHGASNGANRKYWDADINLDGIPQASELSWPTFVKNTDPPMSNTHPSVVYASSCECGPPEYTDNITNTLLKKGASAVISATREGTYAAGWKDVTSCGMNTLEFLFLKYFLLDGQRIGKALRLADTDPYNLYWTGDAANSNTYGFNLFGDPAMKLDAEGPPTAPTVTSISPKTGVSGQLVSVTNLAGTGFQAGASVRLELGSTVVNATSVKVVSDTQITCQLALPSTLGKYDVVVKNPDGQEGRLTKGFSVTNICGQGAGSVAVAFGLMMGLLSLGGSGLLRRRRRGRKSR